MKLASMSVLLLATAVCFSSERPSFVAQNAATASAAQRQFINVDGVDLKSKLSAAAKLGSGQRGRFWVAYAFDVRPGIAFDVAFTGFGGGTVIVNGSTGSPFETRNLGVFLLHEGGRVVRAEIYNLDRPRDYRYPVYWLGRAAGQESLALLRAMIDTVSANGIADRLVDAIGAHDDPSASQMLRDVISTAKSDPPRTAAVSWLGRYPGQVEFLAGLVRDERAHTNVRREAAEAIGNSQEPASTLTILQELYGAVTHREIKRELLEAIADERFDTAAVGFLIQVTEKDPDRELRGTAIERLGTMTDAGSFAALEKAAQRADAGVESQRAAVEAISERSDTEALPLLKKIARSHPRHDVRQEALEHIGERPDQLSFLIELANDRSERIDMRRSAIEAISESESSDVVATLKQLFASTNHRELKETIIEAIADGPDRSAAISFLLGLTRSDGENEIRESALNALGEMNDERAIDALVQFYDTARDEQTKTLVLEALGEADSPRALQKLITVAQRDPSVKLRKRAIEVIGESDDPIAVRFLEQLIK
jgi:HEAT repeat protein